MYEQHMEVLYSRAKERHVASAGGNFYFCICYVRFSVLLCNLSLCCSPQGSLELFGRQRRHSREQVSLLHKNAAETAGISL
jgi:hypothetical protein